MGLELKKIPMTTKVFGFSQLIKVVFYLSHNAFREVFPRRVKFFLINKFK
jgi:hypothetical protein